MRMICRYESNSHGTTMEGCNNSRIEGGEPVPSPLLTAVKVSRIELFCFWEYKFSLDVPK